MLEQHFLEALRMAFWPLYIIAIGAASFSAAIRSRWCLGRTMLALLMASLAQSFWEGGAYLEWWQQLVIDVPVFVIVTMPPRHYWQSTMGGLIFAQIVLHATWAMAPDFARAHWLGCILIGFAKCIVLLLWSGGSRVETVLGRVPRWIAGAVSQAPPRKLA